MIKAKGDCVVVEPIIQEKIGIIFLPDQAKKDVGVVISVGPEYKSKTGEDLAAGQKVFFRKNEGTVIEDKYLSLAPKWVLGVVS